MFAGSSTMKLLFAFLTLTLLPGSRAFVLSDQPRPKLEQIGRDIERYLSGVSRKAVNITFQEMEALGLDKIGSQASNVLKNITRRLELLGDQLPTEVKEAFKKVSEVSDRAADNTAMVLFGLVITVDSYRSKLQETVEALAPYTDPLIEKAEQRTQALRQSLVTGTEELKEEFEQRVKELGTKLEPYTKELRNRVQKVQQGLEPYTQKLQDSLNQGIQQVNDGLQPYLSGLQERVSPYTTGFKDWLSSFWPSLFEEM